MRQPCSSCGAWRPLPDTADIIAVAASPCLAAALGAPCPADAAVGRLVARAAAEGGLWAVSGDAGLAMRLVRRHVRSWARWEGGSPIWPAGGGVAALPYDDPAATQLAVARVAAHPPPRPVVLVGPATFVERQRWPGWRPVIARVGLAATAVLHLGDGVHVIADRAGA